MPVRGVADPAEAHVDHPGAAVDRPADRPRFRSRRDGPILADDLGHEQPGGGSQPGHAARVVDRGRDLAGNERPVALLVDGCAPDEVAHAHDPALELRMRQIDS